MPPLTTDRLLEILMKACLATFIATVVGIIALLIIIFCCPESLGCATHECSNDNAATGPVIVGDELLRADPVTQAITHYEWRRGEESCYIQPYRAWSNRRGVHWTSPWFQPYASVCWPIFGQANYYTVRSCDGGNCSADSPPIEVIGQRYCCFTPAGEVPCQAGQPLCFNGAI